MDNVAMILKAAFNPYFEAPLQVWATFAEQGEVIKTSKNEDFKKYGERENIFILFLKVRVALCFSITTITCA